MTSRISQQFSGFLNTLPLWKGQSTFEIEQFKLPSKIQNLPQNQEIIHQIPSLSENFVLGKRMESFFSFLIQNSTEYRLIAKNLQIVHNNITMGEIDFILQDSITKENLHIEMVYKFYLYDPTFDSELQRWIGPNRKDSLPEKINKLREQQLPLLYRPETSSFLQSLKIDLREIVQQVCFMANLFVPVGSMGKSFPLINNACICGYWLHRHEFLASEFSGNVFFAPRKIDWSIDPAGHDEWFSFSKIWEQVLVFHGKNISPLLWMKTAEGAFQRLFVVWW